MNKRLLSLGQKQIAMNETVKQSEKNVAVSTHMVDEVKTKLDIVFLKMDDHKNSNNDDRENNSKCDQCEQVFSSRSSFKCLKNILHKKSEILCKQCSDNKFNPEQHLLLAHHQKKKIECDSCKGIFLIKWRLEIKKKMHIQRSIRPCHFYNNNMRCPFEINGCKFAHVTAEKCKHDDNL